MLTNLKIMLFEMSYAGALLSNVAIAIIASALGQLTNNSTMAYITSIIRIYNGSLSKIYSDMSRDMGVEQAYLKIYSWLCVGYAISIFNIWRVL
jgi:hypothetical protein